MIRARSISVRASECLATDFRKPVSRSIRRDSAFTAGTRGKRAKYCENHASSEWLATVEKISVVPLLGIPTKMIGLSIPLG